MQTDSESVVNSTKKRRRRTISSSSSIPPSLKSRKVSTVPKYKQFNIDIAVTPKATLILDPNNTNDCDSRDNIGNISVVAASINVLVTRYLFFSRLSNCYLVTHSRHQRQHHQQQRRQLFSLPNTANMIVTDDEEDHRNQRNRRTTSTSPSLLSAMISPRDSDDDNRNNHDGRIRVATNTMLSDKERSMMREALELLEEARDMERFTDNNDGDDEDKIVTQHDDEGGEKEREEESRSEQQDDPRKKKSSTQNTRILDEEQLSLFIKAVSIQESVVGFYHPDVADTYHHLGWSLIETGRYKSALVYFLRALRICHRVLGPDHTSTTILLDDIRDLVVGVECCKTSNDYNKHRGSSSKPANANDCDFRSNPNEKKNTTFSGICPLEEHCNAIFDSWVYQNLAEEAMLRYDDPTMAIRLYEDALRVLSTETCKPRLRREYKTVLAQSSLRTTIIIPNEDGDNENDNRNTTEMTDCNYQDHDGENTNANTHIDLYDDDDYDANYDDQHVCIAELERAFIQLQMAVILTLSSSSQLHRCYHSTATTIPVFIGGTSNTVAGAGTRENYHRVFDLYCKALAVLPAWLSEDHPTVRQARSDASSLLIHVIEVKRNKSLLSAASQLPW